MSDFSPQSLIEKSHQRPPYSPPEWVWIHDALNQMGVAMFGQDWIEIDLDATSTAQKSGLGNTVETESELTEFAKYAARLYPPDGEVRRCWQAVELKLRDALVSGRCGSGVVDQSGEGKFHVLSSEIWLVDQFALKAFMWGSASVTINKCPPATSRLGRLLDSQRPSPEKMICAPIFVSEPDLRALLDQGQPVCATTPPENADQPPPNEEPDELVSVNAEDYLKPSAREAWGKLGSGTRARIIDWWEIVRRLAPESTEEGKSRRKEHLAKLVAREREDANSSSVRKRLDQFFDDWHDLPHPPS